jgi:hypothetical protein
VKIHVAFAVALAACAGPSYQMQLVNRTDRAIESIYVYPTGAADRGASRGSLAPSATTQLKVKHGRTSVLALSAKLKLDDHTRDQPSASQDLEVTGPTEIVFYDSGGDKPPGLERPGVFGIAFQLPKPAPPPPPDPQ